MIEPEITVLPSAQVEIAIPFHDVDVMHVVWHGHYVKYLEIARCALLKTIDYDYPQMKESGFIWPVTECYLKYVRSARYGQCIIVTAAIVEYENRLKIKYLIRDKVTGEKLTQGYTVQVALDASNQELQFVTPPVLWEKMKAYTGK